MRDLIWGGGSGGIFFSISIESYPKVSLNASEFPLFDLFWLVVWNMNFMTFHMLGMS